MVKIYSRFIIASIIKTFLEPVIATWAGLRVLKWRYINGNEATWGKLIAWSWAFYPLSIVLKEVLSSQISSYRRKSQMKQLGCSNLIPKVKGRLIGNIDVLLAIVELFRNEANEYCGDIFAQWAEQYGPTFDMNILGAHQSLVSMLSASGLQTLEHVAAVVDPSNVKHIVATSFDKFEKGDKFHDMLEGFLGTGVFNSDGATWKFYRSMARPFFERERVANPSHFERHTQRLKSLLSSMSGEKGSPFDIQDVFGRYTMDFITDFLFGLSSRTMVPPHLITRESEDLMLAFNALQKAASTRIRIGSNWPLFELFSDRMKGPKEVVDAYIMPIVKAAIDTRSNIQPNDEDNVPNLLEYLVTVSDDPKLIRDTLVAFLLAGRDTTASLLTFVTYVLALHPEVYHRLNEEIVAVCGGDRLCTAENIRDMRYLRAVINETLRLFPPVPFNIRRSTTSPSVLPSLLSNVPNGLYMFPSCSITYSLLHIHRRKDIWGDDAEEFKPERWLAEDSKKVHVINPFAFLPFNGGPRMCLGQNLAYLLASHTIIQLTRKFTWKLAPDSQPVQPPSSWRTQLGRKSVEQCWPKSSLTLYSDHGLFVSLEERDAQEE